VIRERLRQALETHNHRIDSAYKISLSVGIVRINGTHGIEYQLARADTRMYEHKRTKHTRHAPVAPPGAPSPV
jgi:GGDEF domain-containing protein